MSYRKSQVEIVKYLFVRGQRGEGSISFQSVGGGPADQVTLRAIGQAGDIQMPVRLIVPRRPTIPLSLRLREAENDFYLTSESYGAGRDPQIRFETIAGPTEDDETLHGVYYDPASDHFFDFVAVTDPEPLLTVMCVGAAVCLLKSSIETLVRDCAKHCREACGEGRVRKCEVESTFGIKWDKGIRIGCGSRCVPECG